MKVSETVSNENGMMMNNMTWNIEEYREVGRALDQNNTGRFRELLSLKPQYLYGSDGNMPWMFRAAMSNNQQAMEVLLSLGIDINATQDPPSDEFYEPEGAILQAAQEGYVELVQWMLKHGAKINFVFCGQRRCMPLQRAATAGHLAVVKMLVEHGADFNAVWRGNNGDKIPLNAITQAAMYGHKDVLDYLYSLGARDLRETEPRDPLAHQRICHAMKELGPLADWRLSLGTDPDITLRLRPANANFRVHTVFTVGLSDHRLPTDQNPYAANELQIMLPADWPITPEALASKEWGWPIEWISRLARDIAGNGEWPRSPILFINGDPPQPLCPNTRLSGWICLKNLEWAVHLLDARIVTVHQLYPIYVEEAELARTAGDQALAILFLERGIPHEISLNRASVVEYRCRRNRI